MVFNFINYIHSNSIICKIRLALSGILSYRKPVAKHLNSGKSRGILRNIEQLAIRTFTPPIELFEYTSSCWPIVATSLPSIEDILVDENNALLAEPDNMDLLVDAINRVLGNTVIAEKLVTRASADIKKAHLA